MDALVVKYTTYIFQVIVIFIKYLDFNPRRCDKSDVNCAKYVIYYTKSVWRGLV